MIVKLVELCSSSPCRTVSIVSEKVRPETLTSSIKFPNYSLAVLGDFSSFQSLISIQRPFKILKDDGSILDAKAKQIAPDQIMIHGTLKSGVVLAATFRDGAPFKDAPGLEWNILSEKEEIRIKGPSAHIQIFGLARIELHDFETDKVEKIELRKGGFDELPPVHRNSHFLNL